MCSQKKARSGLAILVRSLIKHKKLYIVKKLGRIKEGEKTYATCQTMAQSQNHGDFPFADRNNLWLVSPASVLAPDESMDAL